MGFSSQYKINLQVLELEGSWLETKLLENTGRESGAVVSYSGHIGTVSARHHPDHQLALELAE